MSRYDVIVLGGGIIGAATAEELARKGKRVCLIERGTVGCESSKAAAGILAAQMDLEAPGPLFELCQASRRMYGRWVRHLERQSGLSVDYHEDGILYLALTARGEREMDARQRWQLRRGLKVERCSPREVRRREPNALGTVEAGFFFPTEAQLDNVKLMEALAVACRNSGVAVLERTTVRKLLIRRTRVVGVRTNRQTLRAPIVVNCLGSWASEGGPPSLKPPVVPAKGQILAFDAPKRLLRHILMSEVGYGVQRRTGELIVGSTVEFVGFDRHVTLEGMHHILSGFRRMVKPEALNRTIFRSSWAGLRPCGKDRLPILGATPIEGLYVATGHFRHGILLAPITARLLTELILTGRSSLDLSPFVLARFINQ